MTRLAVNASLRRVAAPAGVAAAVAAVGGALVVLGPGVLVPFRCPFLAMTGLACPFCGGTRGAAALARGDVVAAFGLNALTTVLLLGVALLWVGWLVARLRGQRFGWTPGSAFWIGLLVVSVVFAVLRNLPGPTSALAP